MSWLGSFRRKAKKQKKEIQEDDFGRFSDAFKPTENYQYWEESLVLFDHKKRFSAFQLFFKYLKNNQGKNVQVSQLHGVLNFELIQGSKKITGTINAHTIHVQAILAHSIKFQSTLLTELLQENYNLKFCKFALEPTADSEQYILKLVADLPAKLTSPYKLYYVLRELALTGDKKDDLIFSEYGLKGPFYDLLNHPLPKATQKIFFDYIQKSLRKTLDTTNLGTINTKEYPSALRYLLLATIYKLDFLIKPEGYLMDQFEKIDALAFSSQTQGAHTVNQQIITIFEEMLQKDLEEISKELYLTDATFGFNPVIQTAQIRDTIFSELPTMDWYLEKNHEDYATAIVDFIIGYLLFNYIVPPPCKALFLLYYRITNQKFFQILGFQDRFIDKKLSSSHIKKEIKATISSHISHFPYLEAPVHILQFDSLPIFCKSYLEMIAEMNFTPNN